MFFRFLTIYCVSCFLAGGFAFTQGVAYSQDTASPSEQSNEIDVITIAMESYTFTPKTFLAENGKPIHILLRNESFLVPHNFLLDSPDGIRLIEANVDSGEEVSIQFTPNQSGVYPFYCDKQLLFFPNHREEGMEGSLTVQ